MTAVFSPPARALLGFLLLCAPACSGSPAGAPTSTTLNGGTASGVGGALVDGGVGTAGRNDGGGDMSAGGRVAAPENGGMSGEVGRAGEGGGGGLAEGGAGGTGLVGVFVAQGHQGRITRSQVWYEKQALYRSSDGLHWDALPKTAFTGSHPIYFMSFGYVPASAGCGP